MLKNLSKVIEKRADITLKCVVWQYSIIDMVTVGVLLHGTITGYNM